MIVPDLSADARTVLLLCSTIAAARGDEIRPFGPSGWADLAERISERGIQPADLAGKDTAWLIATLEIADADAERIVRLMARSGQLAFEIERLASRGIIAIDTTDERYPARLRERLDRKAPPVLFVAGDPATLGAGGVAVVGSRDVDADGVAFTEALASAVVRDGLSVVSGGARGVDQVAMRAAFEAGGRVIGVLAEGLESRIRDTETRAALAGGQIVLTSPYHPGAGFSAGAAMGRNKLVYALSDVAVVVASAAESGGTWAGATEALAAGWVQVFVRRSVTTPPGNAALLERGALPIDDVSLTESLQSTLLAPRPDAHGQAAEDLATYEQTTMRLA